METRRTTAPPARTEPRPDERAGPRPAPQTVEEVIERMADPIPPTPTQDEADEFKEDAHGIPDEGPATEAPTVVDVPHVTGGSAVGETLNCTMGNWTGTPTGYAYQWKRDGADITGTGNSYVIVAADAGHALTCVVTATNAIGSTTAPASNAVTVPTAR